MTESQPDKLAPLRPPWLKFRDGPLAGVVRPKSPVNGRMPRFRDRYGEPVPTALLEKYRQPCNCVAFALYMIVQGCAREGYVYRWIDLHDDAHGKDPCADPEPLSLPGQNGETTDHQPERLHP